MAFLETLAFAAFIAGTALVIQTVVSVADYLFNRFIFTNHHEVKQTHNPKYALNDKDKEYVEESKKALHEALGEDPVAHLMETNDAETRIREIQKLTEKLTELYGLEGLAVEFAYDDKSTICGFYSREANKIVLNCSHLLTTNKVLVKDFLDTIFHEFRHAVQYKIISAENENDYRWYLDAKAAQTIAESFNNYISSQTDPKAYYEQYVELDAREIALYILED